MDVSGSDDINNHRPKLKHNINISEIISEARDTEDVELRSAGEGGVVRGNKVILAAASPVLRRCLEYIEDGGVVTITESCHQSLKLTLDYIYHGFVKVEQDDMRSKVQALLSVLQVGKCLPPSPTSLPDDKQSVTKDEDDQIEIKAEPDFDDIEPEEFHFVQSFLKEGQWRNDSLSSLYKFEGDNDYDEDNEEDEDYAEPTTKKTKIKTDEYEEEFLEKKRRKKKKSEVKVKGEALPCDLCGQKFTSQNRLDQHISRRHINGQTDLTCQYCPRTFNKVGDLNHHENTHTKPFKCHICEMSFGRKSNLIGHVRVHNGERPYVCELCGKGFALKSACTTHKKQVHEEESKTWHCDFCEQKFLCEAQLRNHRRTHTKEKPYVCDICGRGFGAKQNMLMHKAVHSDKMEFKCSNCGKDFKWRQQLERHEYECKTGEKRFPCDECNMSFNIKVGLKNHKLSVHSPIKHFKCPYCDGGFSTSSGVTRHLNMNRCSMRKQQQQQLDPAAAPPQPPFL